MTTASQSKAALLTENAALRARLAEAEETLRAIREGEVDAVVVSGSQGDRVFALTEPDNLHRLMVETMNEAGLATTPDGLLVFCNDRACTLLGRSKEQLLGHDLGEFAAPEERDRLRALLQLKAGAALDARLEFRTPEGRSVPLHVWASQLDRPDNPLICLVATDLSRVEADKNLIAQLKGGVHALTTPVDSLESNWAYMVMASLAWSLKAWSALLVPVSPRHAARHEAEKRSLLRMEFPTFCAALIQMPCQIVRTGKRLIYRLLSWNPWQGTFLRLVERLHGCWLC